MRTFSLWSAVLVAVLGAPPAAAAFTWSAPQPLTGPGPVIASVPRADGSTLLAFGQRSGPGQGPGSLFLQRLRPNGDVETATTLGQVMVVAQRPAPTGGVDLLVLEGSSRARNTTGTLALLRLSTALKPRRLWAAERATSLADFGRSALGGYAIAWYDRAGLHVVTSPDGRAFTQPRVLPKAVPQGRFGPLVTDLGVGVDRAGAAVVALTLNASPGRAELLTVSRAGRVVRRQEARGVEGLVQVEQTRGGRVGVLVHDTGVAGEAGECVGDGSPRRVWATAAEAAGGGFRPLRKLNEQSAYCGDGGAPLLVAGPGEALTAVWGALRDATPETHVAQARKGAGFPAGALAWPGYAFGRAAAADPAGGVLVALQHPGVQLPRGVLVARRAPGGAAEAPQELSADATPGTLVVDAAGKARLTWQTSPTDAVLAIGTP
jgi:hypothetical protein